MKKFLSSIAILPVLALSGVAVAGDFPEQGKITSMNSWSITLDNGMLFQITDSNALKDLKPGDDVSVSYVDHPEYGFVDVKVKKSQK